MHLTTVALDQMWEEVDRKDQYQKLGDIIFTDQIAYIFFVFHLSGLFPPLLDSVSIVLFPGTESMIIGRC